MPLRNESVHLGRALESIEAQDYGGVFEVIAVDGGSTDGTRDILERWRGRNPGLKILENPRRITPAALNAAVGAARGEIVVRIDGHWFVPPDYLRRIDEAFRRSGADSVGGRIARLTRGRLSEAIELARRSFLGGGLSERNDPATPPGLTRQPNVATCWKREVMAKVGPFDESLPKNQDNEFNARLLRLGFSTYYDPAFHFNYFPPATLARLFGQMFGYSLYGLSAARREGEFARARSWLLPILCMSCAIGALLALLFRSSWLLLAASAYAFLVLAAAVATSLKPGLRYAPAVMLAYVTVHAAVLLGSAVSVPREALARSPAKGPRGQKWGAVSGD